MLESTFCSCLDSLEQRRLEQRTISRFVEDLHFCVVLETDPFVIIFVSKVEISTFIAHVVDVLIVSVANAVVVIWIPLLLVGDHVDVEVIVVVLNGDVVVVVGHRVDDDVGKFVTLDFVTVVEAFASVV